MSFRISFIAAFSLAASFCYAQPAANTEYNHQELFGPINWPRTRRNSNSERQAI
jgi:hypothetical protein